VNIKSINEPQTSRTVALTPNSVNEPVPLPEGPPTIEGLNPAEMPHGTADQLLVVHGANFIPSCIITFENVELTTVYEAPNKINATLPNDLEAGDYLVAVRLGSFEAEGKPFKVIASEAPPEEIEGELADPDELEDEIEAAKEEGDFKPVHRGRPTTHLPKNRKR
jgi:hypothetical protein